MFEENKFNIEQLIHKKNMYFHIGIPGLTKELENSDMILLASRPMMGKTSFLTRIVNGACLNKLKVAIFSLGLSKQKIMKHIVCNSVGYNDDEIINIEECESNDWNYMYNKFIESGKKDIFNNCYIFDKLYTSSELYNNLLDLDRELNGIDLVVIDKIENLLDYNTQTSADIIRLIDSFQILNNVRIIISTNVSRKCEYRDDKRPRVYEILNYFKISRYFDKILTLYREDYYDYTDVDNLLEIGLFSKVYDEKGGFKFKKYSTFYTLY